MFVRNESEEKQEIILFSLDLEPFEECHINNFNMDSNHSNLQNNFSEILNKLNLHHLNDGEKFAIVELVKKYSDIFYIENSLVLH